MRRRTYGASCESPAHPHITHGTQTSVVGTSLALWLTPHILLIRDCPWLGGRGRELSSQPPFVRGFGVLVRLLVYDI